MKSARLKKITAAIMALSIIASVSPVGASAAWKQDSNGWWNDKGDAYSVGWENINNTWYYFNESGYMETGWVNDNGAWYYTDDSGAMKTGWVNNNGTWYYTSQSGDLKTGWINDNGTWYYADNSGAMKTGWVNDNGAWYYTASTGAMQTGVVKVDNKVYSLSETGAMQTGNVVVEGKTYTFAESGECVSSEIPKVVKEFTASNVDVNTNQNSNNTTNNNTNNTGNNTGNEQKNDTEKTQDSSDKKSSGGSKHHNSSSSDSDKSEESVAKLNIEKQDISFNYDFKNDAQYDIKCDLYNSNNKIIDTIKYDKADKINGSKATIFVTDILGEMNPNDYLLTQIKTDKGISLKSDKIKVLTNDKLNNEILNVSTKKESSKFNCTVTGKANFEEGTYVLYGFENTNNAYVKTVYCDGNTNTLEFKDVGHSWLKNGNAKIKLARIYDTQKVNDNEANCKVQVSDNFDVK